MVVANNYEKKLVCDCLTEQGTKCKRRSTYNINGKNYCNQHSKKVLKDFFENDFKKPTIDEVKDYVIENNLKISPEGFIDYYDANGWKIGRNAMKDWKATIRNWDRRQVGAKKKETKPSWYGKEIEEQKATDEEIRELESKMERVLKNEKSRF